MSPKTLRVLRQPPVPAITVKIHATVRSAGRCARAALANSGATVLIAAALLAAAPAAGQETVTD